MSGPPAVLARGVAFAWGERPALRGIDFTVDPGTATTYCFPPTAYVIGLDFHTCSVSNCHSRFDVRASTATNAPALLSP